MNLGAENRTKMIAAIALGVIAVVALAIELSGLFGGSPSQAATPTTPRQAEIADDPLPATRTAARTRLPGKSDAATIRSLDPSLRFDLLKTSEDTQYEGTGRNIFRVFVEIPKPIITPVQQQQQAQGPAVYTPPPPPPINLVFYGFATPANGAKRIFLAQNDDVFIAKEGDIVDRRYKVVRISPNAVEILDVLSNNRQSIPLTQG